MFLVESRLGPSFCLRKIVLQVRKRWLAFGARTGVITVDKGCEKAILSGGSSVLAAGITAVKANLNGKYY